MNVKTAISINFLVLLLSCSQKNPNQDDQKVPGDMVLIPAGSFMMGGKSDQAEKDEFPRHSVQVSAFYMDKYEVTNGEFERFVEETGYVTVAERPIDWEEMKQGLPSGTPKPPDSVLRPGSLVFEPTEGPVNLRDYSQWWSWTIGANWRQPEGPASSLQGRYDHPVVHIAHEDALAYAQWAGKRLPTEAEWEWAAMGGLKGTKYPWGDVSIEEAAGLANFWQGFFPYDNQENDGFFGTAPVKSFPPNGYGLYDMAGNVWEWCQDKYHYQAYRLKDSQRTTENPGGPDKSFDPREPYAEKYVIRGGSFLCNDSYCSGYRVSRRMGSDRSSSFNHTGFRCVRDID